MNIVLLLGGLLLVVIVAHQAFDAGFRAGVREGKRQTAEALRQAHLIPVERADGFVAGQLMKIGDELVRASDLEVPHG